MHLTLRILLLVLFTAPAFPALTAQTGSKPRYDYTRLDPLEYTAEPGWLKPAENFNKSRFYTSAGIGAGAYLGFGVGLYSIWYKGYELEGFHTFNDWPEWEQMDKAGHAFTAYFFSRSAFAGLRWSGVRRPVARYTALGVANLLQATIETMDGFSSNWGFSLSDMGANLAGSLVFTAQDILWEEQRILIKVSNDFRPPPDIEITNSREGVTSNLGYIVRERFGDSPFERFLKDYNAQTIWLSVNPASFLPNSPLPQWLNLAVGYGAENVYGAYGNSWRENGVGFSYAPQRYRQWYLSPDLYLSRIPTKKRWVRLTLGILDFIKVPAPALEYSKGKFRGRWLM
ncbi:hypothetical protein GGR28_001892 [Lewinella aquimaris]|uniref:DUF2279 domain-containing protein n=1 Tax=Neolewinella aquimaris TaxID=1835722 RepID=A0A840E6C3_9BACT|nr:DUF2279 domain-containing protein [Neolewinella aquimaris]MBB4079272.1 hypothetical protein [Neolewinella aquimaris]